jgi:hypothetical protein
VPVPCLACYFVSYVPKGVGILLDQDADRVDMTESSAETADKRRITQSLSEHGSHGQRAV